MASTSPLAISNEEARQRFLSVIRLARGMGFEGTIEYRHVYSRSGGATYGEGSSVEQDLLTVYARAFERDADPDDFSLRAIIAHERGHQLLARHPKISKAVASVSPASEEILASLLGALICDNDRDFSTLVIKAAVELVEYGVLAASVERQVQNLLERLEALL
ncbi:MAG TPA: hypothetical protein VN641_14300 [Urbifossiella sp.]|nr:hypothetical protein [Urbifossiella sp.]